MDRNEKFLKKLTAKELKDIKNVLTLLNVRKVTEFDIKKLSGYKDVYRVRLGTIRIIFIDNVKGVEVLSISRRSDKTYKNFN